jgi:hypothetical protein
MLETVVRRFQCVNGRHRVDEVSLRQRKAQAEGSIRAGGQFTAKGQEGTGAG